MAICVTCVPNPRLYTTTPLPAAITFARIQARVLPSTRASGSRNGITSSRIPIEPL